MTARKLHTVNRNIDFTRPTLIESEFKIMTQMNDGHRLFLQSFMSRGILNAKEVKQLFKICCLKYKIPHPENEREAQAPLLEFVRTINNHIEPFHMQIRNGVSEDDGSSSYGLVCTSESTITKLASDYTPSELEFFKKLIEIIVASDNAEVGSTETLNLVSRLENVKKLSKDDAEDLLSRLETNKWIKMTHGKISLATRSLLELDQYILEIYQDDVEKCNICKKLCLKGQTCPSCGTKLHFHCASKLFEKEENPKCPKQGCKKAWPYEIRRTPRKGMIHVGIGPTHLVNFLGQCNIPPPSEPSIRKHAAKVGKAITDVALESCRAAQVEEKQTSDTLQASFDGGWQKRGTGWNNNSISGHASMIEKNTGKILAYEVRSKCCRVCDLHAEQNHTVPSHDCPQNWSGSSKAMEADMAMSMAHQLADNDFMLQVNKASSLSPGVYTSSLTQKIDQRRRVKRLHQSSLQYKRRRIQLQKQKRKKERISTVREGVTYKPNLEFNCSVGAQEEIPKFLEFDHSCELVVFDLETTGLERESDITQIAACVGEESFQNYVIPRCNIISKASRLTGITFCRETNCVFLNGKPVSGEHIQDALLNFITFLQSKKSPVLIGHNIKSFDLHILFNRLQEFNLFSTFCQTVRGFIDTLQLSRRVISKEEVGNCYKQEHLVKMLTGQTYAAHNALADVKSLQKLIELRLLEHISNSDYYSIMYHTCMASYAHLERPKKICKSVSQKLSRSGVSLQHVKLAISRDLKAAKMMLQTHKISCKQAENVVKILLYEE